MQEFYRSGEGLITPGSFDRDAAQPQALVSPPPLKRGNGNERPGRQVMVKHPPMLIEETSAVMDKVEHAVNS